MSYGEFRYIAAQGPFMALLPAGIAGAPDRKRLPDQAVERKSFGFLPSLFIVAFRRRGFG